MSTDGEDDRDITFRCYNQIETDDEDEPVTACDTEITEPDHKVGMVRTEAREHGMEQALKFICPGCGKAHFICPVCFDAEGSTGWFRGESTGKMLACHNCNQREYERQRRDPYADGGQVMDLPGILDTLGAEERTHEEHHD